MSKLAEQSLKQVQFADLSQIDWIKGEGVIRKSTSFKIEKNKSYLIEIKDSFLKDNNSIITTNWNRGNKPTEKFYKVTVEDIWGKMIKSTGISYDPATNKDTNKLWSGFLALSDINIIKEI